MDKYEKQTDMVVLGKGKYCGKRYKLQKIHDCDATKSHIIDIILRTQRISVKFIIQNMNIFDTCWQADRISG